MMVCGLRRQIFRQMIQKSKGILCVLPEILVKYAGKDASKTCACHLCGVALSILRRDQMDLAVISFDPAVFPSAVRPKHTPFV